MGDEPIESKEETSQMRQKEIIAELVNYLLGLWPNESNEQVESIPPPFFFLGGAHLPLWCFPKNVSNSTQIFSSKKRSLGRRGKDGNWKRSWPRYVWNSISLFSPLSFLWNFADIVSASRGLGCESSRILPFPRQTFPKTPLSSFDLTRTSTSCQVGVVIENSSKTGL